MRCGRPFRSLMRTATARSASRSSSLDSARRNRCWARRATGWLRRCKPWISTIRGASTTRNGLHPRSPCANSSMRPASRRHLWSSTAMGTGTLLQMRFKRRWRRRERPPLLRSCRLCSRKLTRITAARSTTTSSWRCFELAARRLAMTRSAGRGPTRPRCRPSLKQCELDLKSEVRWARQPPSRARDHSDSNVGGRVLNDISSRSNI
mmetsp:Transcript_8407/g.34138  ORF Transcript_8407/g.34138 Transcript_8407/m.34138 type:complete len:207 (-) Transcript_8407:152-772(-)